MVWDFVGGAGMAIAKKSRHSERLRLDRSFFIYLNQAMKNILSR